MDRHAPLTVEEAREFARVVLRAFPGREGIPAAGGRQ